MWDSDSIYSSQKCCQNANTWLSALRPSSCWPLKLGSWPWRWEVWCPQRERGTLTGRARELAQCTCRHRLAEVSLGALLLPLLHRGVSLSATQPVREEQARWRRPRKSYHRAMTLESPALNSMLEESLTGPGTEGQWGLGMLPKQASPHWQPLLGFLFKNENIATLILGFDK